LKQPLKRAWAEISLSALDHNVGAISGKMNAGAKMMAVVKADAYGHGESEIIQRLSAAGIRYFAVSNLEEALHVRAQCPDAEILILGYTPPECAETLSSANIIQGIISPEYACALNSRGKVVRGHIKLDTGMGRVGLRQNSPEQFADTIEDITHLRNLRIEGLYTHLAVADSEDPEDIAFTKSQITAIRDIDAALRKRHIRFPQVHYLNSAGLLYHNDDVSTLVRAGIILYGLAPNAELLVPLDLRPVMSLRSVISHVKHIPAGMSVSYGRTYTAKEPIKVATVTIGYADGYSRLLSGKADVLVHGKRCPIIGRVCMDQLMLDVSTIDNAAPGDVVTLIGTDGNETITADELAALYGTIGYEVVCGISKRVPRIYI